MLEISTALGNILKGTDDEKAIKFLTEFGSKDSFVSPEIDISFAKISPAIFLKVKPTNNICNVNSLQFHNLCWQFQSAFAQGLSEFTNLDAKNSLRTKAQNLLLNQLESDLKSETAIDSDNRSVADKLRAFASFKSENLAGTLVTFLNHNDVIVRATAAELLSELPANNQIIKSLQVAFSKSLLTDRDYDDAQLAILSTLVKLDKNASIGQLATALNHYDSLIRRRAADLIKENDLVKDYPKLGDIEAKVGNG